MPLYVDDAKQGDHHLLILGDSITVSNCPGKPDGICGWREFLSEACGKDSSYFHFDTLAKGGRMVAHYVEDLPKLNMLGTPVDFITKKDYEAVLIMLGVNDIRFRKGDTVAELKQNYQKLIEILHSKLKKPTPPIYFISILPNCKFYDDVSAKFAEDSRMANEYLQKLADESSCKQGVDVVTQLSSASAAQQKQASCFESPLVQGKQAGGIRFLDLYSKIAVPTQIEGKTVGCLPENLDSGDHLHPRRDAPTHKALAELIAKELKAQSLISCKP